MISTQRNALRRSSFRSPAAWLSRLTRLAWPALLPLLPGCIVMATKDGAPAAAGAGDTGAQSAPGGMAPLREAAVHAHRYVGTALATYHFNEPRYQLTAARNFNSITPENEMKWESIEPAPGNFSFSAGDELVAFASQNGMRFRGHTLVWHSQLAPWVKSLSGADLHAAMLRHIQRVAGHYKGKIAQWDVVNEAMADGDSGQLRPESPFTSLGPGFIEDAFRAAHEADPDALLFYNDYNTEKPGAAKTEAVYNLVKHLKETGIPISGVGFQMHVDPRDWPTAAQIRENFERFAALGLLVEITEMDIPVGEVPGSVDDKLKAQKVLAHDIVAACVAVPRCSGVTVWGFMDAHSWLNEPRWAALRGRMPHYPLPFDTAYAPKPMYQGMVDAFEGR